MSLTQQTLIRLPKIKAGLLQRLSYEKIGEECGVTEKTIDRDVAAWTQTDDFLNWIRSVWLDKYRKVDDVEAFRQATKIMIKTIIARAEARVDIREEKHVTEEININVFSDDEKSILDKAARILDEKSRREPDSIH